MNICLGGGKIKTIENKIVGEWNLIETVDTENPDRIKKIWILKGKKS